MTVVISDLIARVKAEGVEQTTQQIKAVGESAQVTSRALELMAQSYAKTQGGTAQSWMEMLSKGNVAPNAAALAEASRQLGQSTAATVAPAQNLARAATEHAAAAATGARAAQDVASGWKLSDTSVVRFVTSLAGVNLGLNLASGAARALHEQIAASIEAAVELDRVGRALSATYGAGATSAAAFAQKLAPQAGLTVGGVETALTAAGPLTQYGISAAQIEGLTTRAADLSAKFGQPFERTFDQVLQAVESGGNGLAQYGVRLDDVRVKTEAYGGALSGTFDRMTQAQQIGVRYQLLMQQTSTAQGSAAASADTLSGSLDRLSAASARVRESTGQGFAGPLAGLANLLTGGLNQLVAPSSGPDRRAIGLDSSGAARVAAPGIPNFTVPGLTAIPGLVGPPSFIGPVPLRQSELMTDPSLLQGAASSAAAAAQAGVVDIARASPEQIAEIARRRTETSFLAAQTAERNRQGNAGLYGQLQVAQGRATSDDERNRISGELAQLREYQTVQNSIVDAEHQQAAAVREVTEAQSRLTDISLRQREREADMAMQTLDLRRQDIVAQRSVLDLSTAATGAQLVAQPSANALSANSYAQQRIQLVSQVRMSRLLQGQDVSDLPSLDDLINQNYKAQLAQPALALTALDASRNADVAQQAATSASLRERITAAPLSGAQLDLELQNLNDLPAQTQALNDLYQGQRDQLEAERGSRSALDKLATLMADPNFGQKTVNVTFGPVSVRSDQDVKDIADQVAGMVFGGGTGRSSAPAPRDLAGARRGPY